MHYRAWIVEDYQNHQTDMRSSFMLSAVFAVGDNASSSLSPTDLFPPLAVAIRDMASHWIHDSKLVIGCLAALQSFCVTLVRLWTHFFVPNGMAVAVTSSCR